MNALELKGLVKKYGRRTALAGLDLAVPAGSVFGLVGSNGAGKTTSLTIAAGLVRPDAGEANLLGEGPFDPVRHAGRVALVPQDSQLPAVGTARDLLVFYGTLQGMRAVEAADGAEQVLERVHLSDRADSPIRTLSHGMRRRVMIAQALLGDPELVLLDEPLSGLDPREVFNARERLFARRGRQTIVISSHNLHEVERLCDHIAFIEHGRTLRQDSMAAVTDRHHALTYTLSGGAALPLDGLREALPDADWEVSADGRRLVCRYAAPLRAAPATNAVVLRALLDAGVGVEEVSQGSALEKVYLAGVPGRVSPPPPPPAEP